MLGMKVEILVLCILLNFFDLGLSSFEEECVQRHNYYRRHHSNTPPLKIDTKIQAYAQEWANHLAEIHSADQRPPRRIYGENIYWSSKKEPNAYETVDLWYSGCKHFNWSNIRFSETTGFFTQVIWKRSKRLGCAYAIGKYGTYVVADYDPAGNVYGLFPNNLNNSKTLKCADKNDENSESNSQKTNNNKNGKETVINEYTKDLTSKSKSDILENQEITNEQYKSKSETDRNLEEINQMNYHEKQLNQKYEELITTWKRMDDDQSLLPETDPEIAEIAKLWKPAIKKIKETENISSTTSATYKKFQSIYQALRKMKAGLPFELVTDPEIVKIVNSLKESHLTKTSTKESTSLITSQIEESENQVLRNKKTTNENILENHENHDITKSQTNTILEERNQMNYHEKQLKQKYEELITAWKSMDGEHSLLPETDPEIAQIAKLWKPALKNIKEIENISSTTSVTYKKFQSIYQALRKMKAGLPFELVTDPEIVKIVNSLKESHLTKTSTKESTSQITSQIKESENQVLKNKKISNENILENHENYDITKSQTNTILEESNQMIYHEKQLKQKYEELLTAWKKYEAGLPLPPEIDPEIAEIAKLWKPSIKVIEEIENISSKTSITYKKFQSIFQALRKMKAGLSFELVTDPEIVKIVNSLKESHLTKTSTKESNSQITSRIEESENQVIKNKIITNENISKKEESHFEIYSRNIELKNKYEALIKAWKRIIIGLPLPLQTDPEIADLANLWKPDTNDIETNTISTSSLLYTKFLERILALRRLNAGLPLEPGTDPEVVKLINTLKEQRTNQDLKKKIDSLGNLEIPNESSGQNANLTSNNLQTDTSSEEQAESDMNDSQVEKSTLAKGSSLKKSSHYKQWKQKYESLMKAWKRIESGLPPLPETDPEIAELAKLWKPPASLLSEKKSDNSMYKKFLARIKARREMEVGSPLGPETDPEIVKIINLFKELELNRTLAKKNIFETATETTTTTATTIATATDKSGLNFGLNINLPILKVNSSIGLPIGDRIWGRGRLSVKDNNQKSESGDGIKSIIGDRIWGKGRVSVRSPNQDETRESTKKPNLWSRIATTDSSLRAFGATIRLFRT